MPCWSPVVLVRCAWSDLWSCPAGICCWCLHFVYLWVLVALLDQVLWGRGGGGDFAADPASCSFPLVLQSSFHWRFDPDSRGPPAVLALLKGHPSGDHCCQAFSSLDVNVRGACGTWLRNTKSFSPTLTLFLLTLSPSSLHNPPERWEPRFPLLPSMVRRAPHIITS